MFKRNAGKIFEEQEPAKRKPKATTEKLKGKSPKQAQVPGHSSDNFNNVDSPTRPDEKVLLQIELDSVKRELEKESAGNSYYRERYSVKNLSDDVVRMETGLPNRQIFDIVVGYVRRFEDFLNYFAGWKVDCLTLEDQVFMALMKVRQNYTNLHLAQLFNCSTATVRNIVLTFINVLYSLLYEDCMRTIPSREKNETSLPGSFVFFGNCRMVIDCTDIEIARPAKMSDQKQTYSTYRGMNSFKVLIGVAPNAVITYVSPLYPGSTSDKVVVERSQVLSHFVAGDLILADKGFLIQDIAPEGVSINIPPFLDKEKFTANEVKMTKRIAKCRIHVERANARLKDFKILKFIPPYLRSYAETLVKLCAALVNLQFPLMKEITGTLDLNE